MVVPEVLVFLLLFYFPDPGLDLVEVKGSRRGS